MAEKENLPPLHLPPAGGVGKAEQQINNRSTDAFLPHQHYIGKGIAGFPL